MARYDAKQRRENATIKTKDGKSKFPIGDKIHAVKAMQFENRADPPLTDKQKHTVEARAAKYGVGPLAKKNQKKAK